jgi:hypothetical protein
MAQYLAGTPAAPSRPLLTIAVVISCYSSDALALPGEQFFMSYGCSCRVVTASAELLQGF